MRCRTDGELAWPGSAGRRRGHRGVFGVVGVDPVVVAERVLAGELRIPGQLLRPVGQMMVADPAAAGLLHLGGPRPPHLLVARQRRGRIPRPGGEADGQGGRVLDGLSAPWA